MLFAARRIVASSTIGLVALLGAACGPSPGITGPAGTSTTSTIPLSRPTVAIVGDSLINNIDPQMRARLDPTYEVSTAAEFGYTVRDMLPDARLLAASAPDIVVIDLGTNDAWTRSTPPDQFAADYAEMVALFPDSCLVLATVIDTSDGPASKPYDRELATAFNAMIRSYQATHDAVIVDWEAALVGHEEEYTFSKPIPGFYLYAPDHIHPSEAGLVLLTDLIGDGIDSCASRVRASR